jgi:hypothetical protein
VTFPPGQTAARTPGLLAGPIVEAAGLGDGVAGDGVLVGAGQVTVDDGGAAVDEKLGSDLRL